MSQNLHPAFGFNEEQRHKKLEEEAERFLAQYYPAALTLALVLTGCKGNNEHESAKAETGTEVSDSSQAGTGTVESGDDKTGMTAAEKGTTPTETASAETPGTKENGEAPVPETEQDEPVSDEEVGFGEGVDEGD